MYEFHYYFHANKYGKKSRLLITGTNSLMYKSMKLKLKRYMKILAKIRKCLILAIILLMNYDDSNKLIVAKKKDETVGITIKEFVGLKQKMYSFMVNDSSVHKK